MANMMVIPRLIQSPEIQTMYSLNIPVSAIRTKIRQEFERHRYVNQLPVVDVLIFQSHAEFQVRCSGSIFRRLEPVNCKLLVWDARDLYIRPLARLTCCFLLSKETLNYWKQMSHVMKYFRVEEDPSAKLPKNFMSGFLEVSHCCVRSGNTSVAATCVCRSKCSESAIYLICCDN